MEYLLQKREGQKPSVYPYSEKLAARKDMVAITPTQAKKYLKLDKEGKLDVLPQKKIDDTVKRVEEDGIEVVDATAKLPKQEKGRIIMDEGLTDEEVEAATDPDKAAVKFAQKDRERTFEDKEKPENEGSSKKMDAEIAMVNSLNLKNQLELYALNQLGIEIKPTTVKKMREEMISAIKAKHKG